jgi:hypothetical protein
VRVLELAGSVMEELGNPQGPRADAVAAHCREFMLSMKVLALIHFEPTADWNWIRTC